MAFRFLIFFISHVTTGLGPCDPLQPEYCLLPFPNDFWLRENSQSGKSLNFTAKSFPIDRTGKPIDPNQGWNGIDGFAPLMPLMTFWPGLTDRSIANLARLWNIQDSLLSDSPTVLLGPDGVVSHWCEVDNQKNGLVGHQSNRSLLIWPSHRLNDSSTYIVAIRNLRNDDGELVKPSSAFLALRDKIPSPDPDVEDRREHFEALFASLAAAGVAREDLQLAWDFTTASEKSTTGRLVAARDDAYMRVGDQGAEYRITKVESNYSSVIDKKVQGIMRVPFYLNKRCPGYVDFCNDCRLVVDADDAPVFQSFEEFTWEALIPRSLTQPGATPGRVVQYGHGLFGDKEEISYGSYQTLRDDANKYGWILIASDWIGLAQPDVPGVAYMLATDLSNFAMLPDRCTQGVVNGLMLMRMAIGRLKDDKEFIYNNQSVIDPAQTGYYGESQGGILGGVYLAASKDVTNGCFGAGGTPYALLLPRSKDFASLFDVIDARYRDDVDRTLLLLLLEQLWTRAEPAGFLHAISRKPFPDTPTHHAFMHYSLGDAQVSWLGNHIFSRSVDAVMFESNPRMGNETLFGFDMIPDSETTPQGRNVVVGVNYNLPPVPFINQPPSGDTDTHDCPHKFSLVGQMHDIFFRTGRLQNVCGGMCTDLENTPPC